jgi:hypothetical protein
VQVADPTIRPCFIFCAGDFSALPHEGSIKNSQRSLKR